MQGYLAVVLANRPAFPRHNISTFPPPGFIVAAQGAAGFYPTMNPATAKRERKKAALLWGMGLGRSNGAVCGTLQHRTAIYKGTGGMHSVDPPCIPRKEPPSMQKELLRSRPKTAAAAIAAAAAGGCVVKTL